MINPTILPNWQSPSPEKGIILNPSTPSNSLLKSDFDVPIANRKSARAYTKYPLAYFSPTIVLAITIKPLPLPCHQKPSQKICKKL